MSYEISIWTRKSPKVADKEVEFKNGLFYYEGSVEVEPEDIPECISLSFEGIKWLTKLYIEPYPRDEKIIKKANRIAKRIAKRGDGIVLDAQGGKTMDKVVVPSKQAEPYEEARCAYLNVYSLPDFAFAEKGKEILDLFNEYLPEALPCRYGQFEPPKYKYQNGGSKKFLEFWKREPEFVWYTTQPVVGVFVQDTYSAGGSGIRKWKCNCISIEFYETMLQEQTWRIRLVELLNKLMVLLDGFYGEIVRGEPETKASFWEGIPSRRGEVFAIGQPYLELLGLSKENEKRVFTDKDIEIPEELCASIEKSELTGQPISIPAKVLPFPKCNSAENLI